MNKFIAIVALALPLTGCGVTQQWSNNLDANQRAYERSQKILDEKNEIMVNDLKSQQKNQLIAQARAEGEMEKAKAKGVADAAIETAKGEAEANRLKAQSLTPELIRYEVQMKMVESLNDKSVIYLPSNVLPLANVLQGK